jgi:hypothetical protein
VDVAEREAQGRAPVARPAEVGVADRLEADAGRDERREPGDHPDDREGGREGAGVDARLEAHLPVDVPQLVVAAGDVDDRRQDLQREHHDDDRAHERAGVAERQPDRDVEQLADAEWS